MVDLGEQCLIGVSELASSLRHARYFSDGEWDYHVVYSGFVEHDRSAVWETFKAGPNLIRRSKHGEHDGYASDAWPRVNLSSLSEEALLSLETALIDQHYVMRPEVEWSRYCSNRSVIWVSIGRHFLRCELRDLDHGMPDCTGVWFRGRPLCSQVELLAYFAEAYLLDIKGNEFAACHEGALRGCLGGLARNGFGIYCYSSHQMDQAIQASEILKGKDTQTHRIGSRGFGGSKK